MIMRGLVLGCAVAIVCAADAACAQERAVTAFVGARVIDGTGAAPVDDATIVVRDGRVVAIGRNVNIPAGAARVELRGRTVVPGIVNAHGHVGRTLGLRTDAAVYTESNIQQQLALYARYGVTTVLSLGDDGPEGVRVRNAQQPAALDRARLFLAGPVVTANSPDAAATAVAELAAQRVDWVKLRVDDNLGRAQKLPAAVYEAVIRAAHARGLPVAAHIYYLDDARRLLRAGVDFIAHSIRDTRVDDELIALLRARAVCLSPTLTREVSAFVYDSRPAFFDDPFFRRDVAVEVIAELEDAARQQRIRDDRYAQLYRDALVVAQANLKILSDAGVRIAFGTDTGPPGRFQGYFEHLELELMAQAGLTPMQIILSATRDAARCARIDDVGTLAPGKWADFIVLAANPLDDIRNMRTIESVWIAGARVPASTFGR